MFRSRQPGSGAGVAALILVMFATAACTPTPTAGTTLGPPADLTTSATTSASTTLSPSGSAVVTVPDLPSSKATDPSTEPPTVTTPVIAPVIWTLSPTAGAVDVSPVSSPSLSVAAGSLRAVTLFNSDGRVVEGAIAGDGSSWTATEKLGYGRSYTIAAVAVDAAGVESAQNYQFATLTPLNKTLASGFPLDGMTVGVGQPIAIFFDEPIADKAGVEKLITVQTAPAVEGAFYWLSNKEVHWRPKDYWQAGTTVDVSIDIYGKDVGNGIYGERDKHFAFTIGQSKIAIVDDATHTMTIFINGVATMDMPVSLGRNKYPTNNGVHVVAENYETKVMDSSTWGLTGAGAYKTEVKYASRISSGGEFVHAAPWSVDSQGRRNVSHGCINVSTANARWFYENFTHGDIVDIRGTVGLNLEVWDGYGDWQVPWETYRLGGQR